MTSQASEEPEQQLTALTAPRAGIPELTTTSDQLTQARQALAGGSGPVAVDAERASGYRYGQRAYLVQLRRAGAGTVLVDPAVLGDLNSLGEVLQDATWVLHAADQDLPCLREVGMSPPRLFDTELAARLLGRQKVGLGPLVASELGWSLAKEHSAADWSQRPLPEEWLRYAALDVELLIELAEVLYIQLEEAGKLAWAEEEFEAVRIAGPPAPRPDPWRRTAGIHILKDARSLAMARELWWVRDSMARARDRSPTRVLPDAAIIAAAAEQPTTVGELRRLPGFGGRGIRRDLPDLIHAVQRAAALPFSELPPRRLPHDPATPPPPRAWAEKDPVAAERLQRVRTAVRDKATELTMPQENLLAPATQRQLAWQPPAAEATTVHEALLSQGARTWQATLLAQPLTHALAGDSPSPAAHSTR